MLDIGPFAHVDHNFEDALGAPLGLIVGFVCDEMAAGTKVRSGALEWGRETMGEL